MEAEPMMEDVATGARIVQRADSSRPVVLVVLEVNKDICTLALNWAFHHVVRRGDTLRLVGILSHVLNPMGYKCRLDENSWLGANRRILDNELANKLHMLHNIEDLDLCCQKAGVQMVIEVKAGLHPKMIVVEEAKKCNAYHVVLDRTMKKDKKYFVDNLTCFVTRVKNSGGVDSIRSFAMTHPLSLSGSRNSSLNSSLRGASMSSTKYNQVDPRDFNDMLHGNQWNSWRSITGSSGTTTKRSSFEIGGSSCDELGLSFGPPPGSEPSSTDNEMAFEMTRSGHQEWNNSKARRLDLGLATVYGDAVPPLARAQSSREGQQALAMPKTNAFFSRSISVPGDRVASGRIGVREKAAKVVWIWTSNKEVMAAAVGVGWTTFVFTPHTKDLADDWTTLARIRPLYMEECQIVDAQNGQVAAVGQFTSSEQLEHLPSVMGEADVVVMNAPDSQWSLIQVAAAERMVTAFQASSTALYAVANSASDSQIYLEALGKGTDGVVLHTDDPAQIYALKDYLKGRGDVTMGVRMLKAMVTQVEPVGLGDRVCVDLCNLLQPGEGLLVGSFSRALFLVHSDFSDIDHTASRPFRVNAGPVHAYVGMAGGVTSYLSELHTGSQVLVVNAQGQSRTVLVGRVKIESRPLLLVEVEVEGQRHSVLLQNSENVCLVSPGEGMTGRPIPVTRLKIGQSLLLNLQDEESDSGNEFHKHMVEK